MSGQRGRAKKSNIDLMDEHHYVGFKYLLTQKCIMDFKLLFEDLPEKIIPYDYDAYFSNPDRFVMATPRPGRNMANRMFDWAFAYIAGKGSDTIRIDTHRDNVIMKHVLTKYGFTDCGVIYLESGHPAHTSIQRDTFNSQAKYS